ncbi:MAG: hypothetical protein KHZ17_11780, partial [Roseburia sp.]|nr:hypothetical protein [Roseburia sp.]
AQTSILRSKVSACPFSSKAITTTAAPSFFIRRAMLQNKQKKKTHHIYQTIANMMCFIIMSKFLT